MFAMKFLLLSIRMKQGNFGFSDGRDTDNENSVKSENISSFHTGFQSRGSGANELTRKFRTRHPRKKKITFESQCVGKRL